MVTNLIARSLPARSLLLRSHVQVRLASSAVSSTPVSFPLKGEPGYSSLVVPPFDDKAYYFPMPTPRTDDGIDFAAERQARGEHAEGTTDLWRKLTLYVALPLCAVFGAHIMREEYNHFQHVKHVYEENDGKEEDDEPAARYDYLDVRRKDFFWGRQSLFFNKYTQHRVADA